MHAHFLVEGEDKALASLERVVKPCRSCLSIHVLGDLETFVLEDGDNSISSCASRVT